MKCRLRIHFVVHMEELLRSVSEPVVACMHAGSLQLHKTCEDIRKAISDIVLAVEYLAKQSLPFRGHRDDRVDFSCEHVNRWNFIATLQHNNI